jgi:hypothetical protein
MKNFRILMSVLAFTVAIGSTFAFRTVSTVNGYKMLNDVTPVSIDCQLKKQCDPEGEFRCKFKEGQTIISLFKVVGTACDQPVNDTQEVQ